MPPFTASLTEFPVTVEWNVPSRSIPTSPQLSTVLPETVTRSPQLPQMPPPVTLRTTLPVIVTSTMPAVLVVAESPPHHWMPCAHVSTELSETRPRLENPRSTHCVPHRS